VREVRGAQAEGMRFHLTRVLNREREVGGRQIGGGLCGAFRIVQKVGLRSSGLVFGLILHWGWSRFVQHSIAQHSEHGI
jgi:hypothetical protein